MEEVELKYVPEPDSDKHCETKRNTTCFICLNNTLKAGFQSHNNDDSLPPNKITKVSLFRICHYLKINLRGVISTNLSEISLLPEPISNMMVSVCSDCKAVVGNLSKLLEQLELLQMKVDYTLQKFMGTFKANDFNLEKDYQFHFPNGAEQAIPKAVAENLRAQITEKCNKRLNAVVPKVLIAKVLDKQIPVTTPCQDNTSPPPSSPQYLKEEPSALPLPHAISSPKSKQFIPSHLTTKWKLHKPINPQHKSSNNSNPSKRRPAPGYRLCTLCSPNRTVGKNNMERHRIDHHFESYLVSHKIPNLTMSDFKIYCEHVYKVELLSSKKILTSDGLTICQCAHCPNPFTDQHGQRNHLLSCHRQLIVGKLVKLQKSTSVEEIKEINLPRFSFKESVVEACQLEAPQERNTDSSYYTCEICQPRRIVHLRSRGRHLAQFHATTIFSDSKLRSDMPENDFRLYCEHIFDTEIKSCGRTVDEKQNEKIKCSHCQKMFTEWRTLRRHLILEHKQLMADKLQESLSIEQIKENFKKVTKADRNREKLGKQVRYKFMPTGINCVKCGKSFETRFSLKRHLINVHRVEPKKAETPTGKQSEIVAIGEVEKERLEKVNKAKRNKAEMAISIIANQVVGVPNADHSNFEHTEQFVTKVEVSASDKFGEVNGENYAEMEMGDNEELDFDDKDVGDIGDGNFDVEVVPDRDPLEM